MLIPLSKAATRRAATYIDTILKGTKPADLRMQQPAEFELTIKLKTAKAVGINSATAACSRRRDHGMKSAGVRFVTIPRLIDIDPVWRSLLAALARLVGCRGGELDPMTLCRRCIPGSRRVISAVSPAHLFEGRPGNRVPPGAPPPEAIAPG
jgi:hypothetical protein